MSPSEPIADGNLCRFCGPVIQSWPNRDPIGEAGFEALRSRALPIPRLQQNSYWFVGNSPISFVDPLGLSWTTYSDCSSWEAKKCAALGYDGCSHIDYSFTDGFAIVVVSSTLCFKKDPPRPPSPPEDGGGGGPGPSRPGPPLPPCVDRNRPPTVNFPPGPPISPPRFPVTEPPPGVFPSH